MILNFKEQFKEKILSGTKKHTLRRGERFKDGDILQFYTGLRTKKAKKFAEARAKCVLYIDYHGDRFEVHPCVGMAYEKLVLGCNKHPCEPNFWQKLAENDGFDTYEEMLEFFKENGKVGGYQIIVWEGLKEV